MRRLKKPAGETLDEVSKTLEEEASWKERHATAQATSEKLVKEMDGARSGRGEVERVRVESKLEEKASWGGGAEMGLGMKKMVELAFTREDEIPNIYSAVREWIKAVDAGHASDSLNHGEDLWHQLARTVAAAKVERLKWEMDNKVAFAAMMADATAMLQGEKDSGRRSKQITDKDVENAVANLFPDAWRDQELDRERVLRTVGVLESLYEQVGSRIRSLQTMVNKGR